MKQNRFIIIGLGNIGRDLLRRLSRDCDILCVNLSPESREIAKKARGKEVPVIVGDATSRLVLKRADVDDADGVIITTTDETITVEVAEVLKRHFQVRRIIAVGITPQGVDRLDALGVEVQNLFTTSSISILNRLERTARAAHSIGLAKNEILEVEVHPNSKLVNKPLRALAPVRWKVGIVYRDGRIIVPGSNTLLKPKDKVIILGEPSPLKTVSELLTFSFQKFPLEYGSQVLTYLSGREDEAFFLELEYLFQVFPLKKLCLLYSHKALAPAKRLKERVMEGGFTSLEERETRLPPLQAIEKALAEDKMAFGLVVLSKGPFVDSFSLFPGERKKNLLHRLLTSAVCPILLLKGTFPYERIVVPGVPGLNTEHILETAFEIASSLHNQITVLLTSPSEYIASDEEFNDFTARRKEISDMSLMYKRRIDVQTLSGNPVRSILELLPQYNFFLADARHWKRHGVFSSFLDPDVMWRLVRQSPVSTLLPPPEEESL